MIFQGSVVILLAGLGGFGLWKASQAESGLPFLGFLLGALLAIGFIPGLVYRIYALQRARYILSRDGISLYWGLQREEIPSNQVLWVGPASQKGMKLKKPLLRLPGSILGMHAQLNGKPVEFLAAEDADLVLIVCQERIFAISPADSAGFLQTYRRLAEFGSLSPIPSVSEKPAFLLSRSWADRPGRILLISSALLTLSLIIWVSLSIPGHPMVSLRLNPGGAAPELVPGIRLLLLPVLNTFFFIADLLLGLFFYRRADTRSLAYLMWASSSLTSLLFMGAVFFILRAT